MDFRKYTDVIQRFFYVQWRLVSYLVILGIELFLINQVSDLPLTVSGWVTKAEQLRSFEVPSDNFYGPGAAIMWIPFLPLKNQAFLTVLIYFLLGSIAYWKIANLIRNKIGMTVAVLALPFNFYLIWLINSSQDTVFEFCLLLWSAFFLIKRQYLYFSILTYLLSITRAGYWTFFLGTSLLIFIYDLARRKKVNYKLLIAIPLLLLTSIFNYINYDSPSPALEGGMTAYFSYSKYHYLSLPKMDMDVFLSGSRGIFSKEYGVTPETNETGAQVNNKFQKAAVDSAIANKKETLLGWMQKVDSYIFDVQKIPHLPGRYVLDLQEKVIRIENERLTWPLVMGNFAFFIYRILLVCTGFLAAGMVLLHKLVFRKFDGFSSKYWSLLLPYIFGIVPGVLLYSETRFKIVSELLLVPLIVGIWTTMFLKRGENSNLT